MVNVVFQPANGRVMVPKGTSILEASHMAGLSIESPCNGTGTCEKCKVRVAMQCDSDIRHDNDPNLSQADVKQSIVLACQTQIQDDITVWVQNYGRMEGSDPTILCHATTKNVGIDSYIKKRFSADDAMTRIYGNGSVLGSEPGNTADQNYGVVVDIGTTTLVAALMDMNNGAEIQTVSSLNPQSARAQDVLSRITIASEEQGLALLYAELSAEINRMIDQASRSANICKDHIYEVVYSGNTCMLHLATGVSPASLGRYPYCLGITGGNSLKAAEYNLDISKFGRLYLPPVISAYVGADITSGILACGLHHQKETVLFVDIGTNGEMALTVNGKLYVTSTAAGPAFEGMNISQGMRAQHGAVSHFDIAEDGSVAVETIGSKEASGICGSGLVDIVGELVTHDVILKNGRFADPHSDSIAPALRQRLFRHNGKLCFQVADGVYLLQKDIRQVQLAKGAIRAGIEILLQHCGISAADIERVWIAGAFGYYLETKSLINIGIVPPEFEDRIEFLGNTSKSGGQAFLLNQAHRLEMKEMAKTIEGLELSSFQGFDRVFVKHLNFS